MHDSSFWYTYGTVGPRGAREGPGGAQHPLAPPQIRLCHQQMVVVLVGVQGSMDSPINSQIDPLFSNFT